MNYNLDQKLVEMWADMLVNYSLSSQFKEKNSDIEGKKILIQGEICAEELMIALSNKLIDAGAIGVLKPFFSNVDRRNPYANAYALEHGNVEQFCFIPKAEEELFKEMDGFVSIIGTENPNKFNQITPSNVSLAKKQLFEINEQYRLRKIWNLTMFPTMAESIEEKMPYSDYANFVISSSLADYVKMKKEQEFLAKELTNAKHIRIQSYNPLTNRIHELNMEKGNNIGISCHGQFNVPDGEVFTSPYAKTVSGEIYLDIPIFNNGLIGGVYLKLEDGIIIDYMAKQGGDLLKAIIETDSDSHKIGEFAIGTNYNVTRNLRNALFAEKIGGSIHLAIGCSYEEPYGLNKLDKTLLEDRKNELVLSGIYSNSAQHVDIPKDFRNPKRYEGLWLDSKELVWKENLWRYK